MRIRPKLLLMIARTIANAKDKRVRDSSACKAPSEEKVPQINAKGT